MKPVLIIGNKNHSSWSLRPWLVLEQAKIPFREILIQIHQSDSLKKIRKYSPAGKVPAFIDGKTLVWESLAICEYLAEKFPKKNLWPKTLAHRAWARSISHEMHAGFGDLRNSLPMNCQLKTKLKKISPAVREDIRRIQEIWTECRKEFSGKGAFLFGNFTIADAMYAPVCLRFQSYGVYLNAPCRTYQKTILSLPAMQKWLQAALLERQLPS